MTLNNPKPRFQGHAILQRWISPKSLKIRPYLLWKAYPSFPMIPFSMILSDLGFVYSADADADANPDAEGGRGRGLCVFGGLCVDMWRLVHQWSFLLLWLSFDCFWRLIHCWYTVGTVLVDMWRLAHQWSFLVFWLSFDCFWRLVHCWYSLGRPVTIGTPMVLTVFVVKNSQKTVKTAKNDHWCTNRHMSTKTVVTVYCRSGEEQSHKSPTPGGAVVLMSTVGLSSLFSFILWTRLAYDVSTNLELAS